MDKAEALRRLREHEPELRAMGIEHLSIFGSTARGEAGGSSDIDLSARLVDELRYDIVRLSAAEERLAHMLGTKVDLVPEPVRRPRLQAEIDRDRVDVF